jgi:amino acid adenylation domain-containing protein
MQRLIASLSPEKRALLALRNAPSFAQQRLWFLDRLEPGSPVYNGPAAVELDGWLNVAALRQVVDEIARRHEALRTIFPAADGQPIQFILAPATVPLPVVDLRGLPAAEREQVARRLTMAEAARPFDLAAAPSMRARVLRRDDARHTLLLTMHHIISDKWSFDLFAGELSALYGAFAAGRPAALPEPELQYADYARWQRQWLRGEDFARQLDYWKRQLAEPPPALALPTDRPRAARHTHAGQRRHFAFAPGLVAALRDLCRRESVTPFMALLAAFQMLLGRYTGQRDFTLGTAVAGRNRAEFERLLGCFVNVLVLRSGLPEDPCFADALARVRATTLAAYANQDVPFERLVEELQPERALGSTPLFQATFAVHNTPASEHTLLGLTLRTLEVDALAAKLDLMVSVVEQGDELRGYCEYSTDLFDRATISRLLGHFQRLVAAVVADPRTPLSALPLLGAAERHQLLVEWNDTDRLNPTDNCLHQLFEAQVARTPDAVAIATARGALTYGELNRRANRLARHLRHACGVGRECPVGLMTARNERALVAIIAILKAGGVYVPVDPNYPAERVEFMLRNAGLKALLLDWEFIGKVSETEAQLFALDLQLDGLTESAENLACVNAPTDLAYIIYTSGSTGQPKGVMIEHGGVVNLVAAQAAAFRIQRTSRVLQFASLSFDASVSEIFKTLLTGATLCLPSTETPAVGGELLRLLHEQEITAATIPPSILAATPEAECPALATLVVAGEAAPPGLVARWAAPRRRCINAYGPTETTVCATIEARADRLEPLPIGRPIDNTRVYVLDGDQMPAPFGVPGELYVESVGLSRGYVGSPDLTAAKFSPNPFSVAPGARLYRTGDLARHRPDGRLEFLGRVDHQVKVRGFRIELGEIEAALRAQPGVRDAAVLARDDARLMAYVVCSGDAQPAAAELRERLQARLPEHLLPSGFVFLDALSLTPNGKVDRKALGLLSPASAGRAAGYVAPLTEVEEKLADIWAGVLGVERPGVNSNFFEAGHSLLAVQLVAQVCDAFQIELALSDVFESPTLGGLARRIEAARAAAQSSVAGQTPAITRVPRDGHLPLSFAQQRIWFFNQLDPNNPAYNLLLALRLTGAMNVAALEQNFNEVVRRHEALRTRFALVGGRPMQVIAPRLTLPLPVIDLRGVPAHARAELARRLTVDVARRPIDLAAGPVVNLTLLRVAPDEHVLLFVIHHIVADAWSLEVLTRELAGIHSAYAAGQPSRLPELEIQYADFAHWQRQWMQGAALGAQLGYWTRQLADSPRVLELPTDRPRPALQSFDGARALFQLAAPLTDELKALGQRQGATFYMTLLAAYAALLHRYTGQTDILLGSPIANRARPEVEGLIGFFLNNLVLRTRPAGDLSFDEFLAQVRQVTLAAYDHQDVPFERLVEELQPERALSHAPLVQALFAYRQGTPPPDNLSGLSLSLLEIDPQTAKFDLAFFLIHEAGALKGTLEYSTALFDAPTIKRFLGHFSTLLAGVAADPARRLSDLPLMTAGEQHQLLVEWNSTAIDYAPDLCLHQLFETQAGRTPDRIALVYEDEQLTYGELDRRANLLARHLRRLGVGCDDIVGVCVERSAEMLVAMLGALKAGAAYLPLDPLYPQERLAFVLEETRAPVLLTERCLLAGLPAQRPRVVCLDTDWADVARDADDDLAPRARPTGDNLAYVIYTSGSTGQPKGVQITQRGVVNILLSLRRELGLSGEDVLLAVTSITFDIAVVELFLPVLVGARVVVASRETTTDASRLLTQLAADGCTAMQATPATWRMLLASGWARGGTLKIFSAGEALLPDLAAQLLVRGSCLWDVYGPTETTIYSTAFKLERPCDPVPIGRPLDNNQVYILDEHLRPVPVGLPGKLHISGDGLARGYLNRPHLSAERFLPNPFAADAGARMYDTGDVARYRPGGVIEYLGRLDHQVKVRGFRIELGEIESVLGRHAEVGSAVVVARGEGGENQRLIAYVVPKSAHAMNADLQADERTRALVPSLQAHLRAALPEYMLPSVFVFLDELPLTTSGKVNRRALPEPKVVSAATGAEYQAPKTKVERAVAAIWSDALGVERVGLHDNFFDLGGHSLLVVQVHSRLRETFKTDLSVVEMFRHPTVSALAARVERAQSERPSFQQAHDRALKQRAAASRQKRLPRVITRPQPAPQREV